MTKPISIARFELAWWGSTAAWLVGTLLSWDRVGRTLAADPRTAPAAGVAQPLFVVIVVGLTVLLWWLVARRASAAGKWLVVALAVVSAIGLARRVIGALEGVADPLSFAVSAAGSALALVATALLFRPDADEWFGVEEEEA